MGQHSIGERFGDYTLVRPLGEGGFASVYLGQEVHRGTPAAVKLPKEQQVHDFINELRRTVLLQNPNIIKILDFGIRTPDNTAFIIMEYAPNGSFRDKYPRGTRVPLNVVVPTVTQVASALQYAHDQRVIHRDVKPENLLLNDRNMVLLSDFGIATASRTSMTANTGQGDIIGTYAYMAPEQLKGRPVPASDQYSLGIMVYEWLCGALPFEGREYIQWYYLHEKEPPPPLREHLPSVSPAVEQVVLRALAKKPEERFERVETFALALEQAVRGEEPPVITTPRPTEHATQFDSSTNLAPTLSKSVDQLFREGVQAQASGNAEEAFSIWRQIMMTEGVAEQYRTTARNRIRELREPMIPLRLKQAREASMQGRWQDEIRLWEDLIVLEPTIRDLAPHLPLPLTLDLYSGAYFPENDSLPSIQERLQIARQNEQCVWMYKGAQQYIQNKNYAAARTQLQMLWHDAPYYGDPEGLAQTTGLPPALNYEQAIAAEQKEKKRLADIIQVQHRQAQLLQEQKEAKQKRNERMLLLIMGAVVIVGIAGGVGIGSAVGGTEGIVAGVAIGVAASAIVAGIIVGASEVKTVYGVLAGGAATLGGGVLVGGILIGGGIGGGVEFSVAYGIVYAIVYGIVHGIASS